MVLAMESGALAELSVHAHADQVVRLAASTRAMDLGSLEALGHAELEALGLALGSLRTWVEAQLVAVCREGDARRNTTGRDGRDILAASGALSSHQTRLLHERAELCAALPAVDAAHARGSLSGSHVDALVRACDALGENGAERLAPNVPELLERARRTSPDTFARHVRDLVARLHDDDGVERLQRQKEQARLRWWTARDGMRHFHGVLDPESADTVETALIAELKRLWRSAGERKTELPPSGTAQREQLAATALVKLIAGSRGKPGTAQVVVVVDLETLTAGLGPGSIHHSSLGTPLPPESLRRLACDAGVIPVVLGSNGLPLDVGQAARSVTPAQKAALRALYSTCAVADCQVGFDWCQIHHIRHWVRHRGPTDLDNLVPLCSRHHHCVHEGGWELKLLPDRTLKVYLPDGRVHSVSHPPRSEASRSRSSGRRNLQRRRC